MAQNAQNVIQGTKEWFEARKKKITASVVAALFGKHPFKDIDDLVQLLTDDSPTDGRKVKSFAMSWGTHFEDAARKRYEEAMKTKVDETGFWLMKDAPLLSQKAPYSGPPFCGGSPDGIVPQFTSESGHGIIEIKSPHTSKKPKQLVDNMMHIFQLVMNMFCTGSTWSHFISYTPMGLTVELCPRPDSIALGKIDSFQYGEQENWEKLGVYDGTTGKYPGYSKVFFDVIFSFYRAVTSSNTTEIARTFAFDYYESIRLVNEVHNKMKDEGHLKLLYSDTRALPVPAQKLTSRVEWTPMMMWQMNFLAHNKESKQKRPWMYRFHTISKTAPHVFRHCMDIQPCVVRKPSFFNMTALCVDIVYKNKRSKFKCKKLTLDASTTLPQIIKYWRYEQQQLPSEARAVITFLNNGFITDSRIINWTLAVDGLEATYFNPIQLSPSCLLKVDCMHRHVLVEHVAPGELTDKKSADNA